MLLGKTGHISEEGICDGFALTGVRGCNPLQAHLRHFSGRRNGQQM